MREPWQAAEILEEIMQNADTASARDRIVDRIVGEVSSLGPVAMHIHYSTFPPLLEVEYHYFVSAIMQGIKGNVQEVLDWLKTGLKDGQEVWLCDSDQANEQELVVRMKYTDQKVLDRYRESTRQ